MQTQGLTRCAAWHCSTKLLQIVARTLGSKFCFGDPLTPDRIPARFGQVYQLDKVLTKAAFVLFSQNQMLCSIEAFKIPGKGHDHF